LNNYARFKLQLVELIQANGPDFLPSSVIKYVCRYEAKNGIGDLKKALSFIDKMIAEEESKEAARRRRLSASWFGSTRNMFRPRFVWNP